MSTYRFDESYEVNYQEGPSYAGPIPSRDRGEPTVELMGLKLHSRVGIFSGPLLNARWIDLYARLGFDLLAYKTVRSAAHPCHPMPNCARVRVDGQLSPRRAERPAWLQGSSRWPETDIAVSMTNSFGMPSRDPAVWMHDVQHARHSLSEGQALIVSVVGRDVEDYAGTAVMAMQAGAHAVEVNLSCPNVRTGEGSIYTDACLSRDLVSSVKRAIGATPLVIKVGYIEHDRDLYRLLDETAPYINAVSAINTVPMEVRADDGTPLLGPERRTAGICGDAIRACGLSMARRVADWRSRHNARVVLLMGGGIMTPEHVQQYMQAGSDVAMMATGAMLDPLLAEKFQATQWRCLGRGATA